MPVFPDATLDEIRHFVHEAGARFALAEDQEQVDKMLDLREQGATIEHIIYDDPRGLAAYADPGLISWEALQAKGAERLAPQSEPARRVDRPRAARRPGGVRAFVRAAPASPRAWC